MTTESAQTTNPDCAGCGSAGNWAHTEGARYALMRLGPNDSLYVGNGPAEGFAVRVFTCRHCGFLRLYEAGTLAA
jgi:hypothetical protein